MKNQCLLLVILFASASFSASAQISRYSTFPTQRVQTPRSRSSSGLSPENELYRQLLEKEQNEYRRAAELCIQQTKEYYAATEHPLTMSVGWHGATAVNEALWLCQRLEYYVNAEGQITERREVGSLDSHKIQTILTVKEGKVMYPVTHPDTGQLTYSTLYF
jgi:hypothetical protein